ncbi:hypothetical protein BDR07DRAFT_1492927 [Suillus spraguei]|nr:hypothetical protein BDR07DRAFT_1492927 [Suillus spraguei]
MSRYGDAKSSGLLDIRVEKTKDYPKVELEETRRNLQAKALEKAQIHVVTLAACQASLSGGGEKSCARCIKRGKACTWNNALNTSSKKIRTCDICHLAKEKCGGGNLPARPDSSKGKKRACEGTFSPKGKGKKRQHSPKELESKVEVVSSPRTIIGEETCAEYDDQAWVAAANNIVAELSRTNAILERGIQAAEGSQIAMDRVSAGFERFLQEQREFQTLFLEGLRNVFRPEVEKTLDSMEGTKGEEEVQEEAQEGGGEGGWTLWQKYGDGGVDVRMPSSR